jgi:hypothetical protein
VAPSVPTDITKTKSLAAGDSWRWLLRYSDYPASEGWTLAVYFVGLSRLAVDATPNDEDPDAFDVVADPSDTAAVTPGTYRVQVRVSSADGTEKTTLHDEWLTVTPDLAVAEAGALLTHEEKCIPLLEAAIVKRVTVDLKAYTLTTHSATKEELKDMQALLTQYREFVAKRLRGSPFETVKHVLRRSY